jgi:alpha-beta hydrolase superfamily lysophospholipase
MEQVMEKIWFSNSLGQRLAGCLQQTDGRDDLGPTVVLCHGMMSSKEGRKQIALAEGLSVSGFSVLRFDFSFCGQSEGHFEEITFTQEIDDVRHAIAWVRQRGAQPIGLLGSSMGGAVAILYSQHDPGIEALVTIAAVAHPLRIANEIEGLKAHVVRWKEEGYHLGAEGSVGPAFLEDARRQDVVSAVRRIMVPLLILHGERDEVVPVEEAYDLFHNAGGVKELRVIAGGDHRLTRAADLESAMAATRDWFKGHLHPHNG